MRGNIQGTLKNVIGKSTKPMGRFRKAVINRLLPHGGSSRGNRLEIYSCGNTAFTAMWQAIRGARHSVCLETYEMAPDAVGHRTIAELTRARQRGCDVTLMYDEVGSARSFLSSLTEPLVHAGGNVIVFNSIVTWPWRIKHPVFLRNHRKILVIDDEIGFCGGMNLTEDYVGAELGGTGLYRDTHVRVVGPAVLHLKEVFNDTVMDSGFDRIKSAIPKDKFTEAVAPYILDATYADLVRRRQVTDKAVHGENESKAENDGKLESNTIRGKRHIQKALRLALRNSQSKCFITTPYFIPPARLQHAIFRAARNGADVRILTSGANTDVPMARAAAQHMLRSFLRHNVRVYEMSSRTLHAKTVTIDGVYGAVGSFNWDIFSNYRNLEVTLTTLDETFATELEKQFLEDLEGSEEVKLESLEQRTWPQRLWHWFSFRAVKFTKYLY